MSKQRVILQCIILFQIFISQILAENNIVWISEELAKDVLQVNADEWDSSGIYTCQNSKSLIIKSQQNPEKLSIKKTYFSIAPHAYLLLQLQVFQIDEFSQDEGFTIQIDDQTSSILRYTTVGDSNMCGNSQIDQIYTERFSVPHTSEKLTLQFYAILQSNNKLLAINNLKIGIIPCEKTCAECKFQSIPSQNLNDLLCIRCPDNAVFSSNTNICTCISDYYPDFTSGYMICIKKPDLPTDVSAKCQQELNDYSTSTRIVPISSVLLDKQQQQNYAQAKIYTYQFFPAVSVECQPLIKYEMNLFNNQALLYKPISRKYIRNQIQGEVIEVAILLSEIPNLANYLSIDSSRDFLYSEIYLALKLIVGTKEFRTHRIKLIYTTNHSQQLATAFNQDFSKNMNQIILNQNANPNFIEEYNFELKRYLCTDKACNIIRSNYGYSYQEEVIARVQFQVLPSNINIVLNSCHTYIDNNQMDIISQVKIIESNLGYITLSFSQMHQFQPMYGSSYNQVYLQISITYLDHKNKQRVAQVTLIYYALKPTRLLSLQEFDQETIDFLHTNPDDLLFKNN